MAAPVPEPIVIVLGSDPAAGIFFADAIAFHQPLYPVFHRGGNGNGHMADFRQTAFEKTDGIDGSQCGGGFQLPENFLLYGAVGDPVQILQGSGIGKDDGAQLFPMPEPCRI